MSERKFFKAVRTIDKLPPPPADETLAQILSTFIGNAAWIVLSFAENVAAKLINDGNESCRRSQYREAIQHYRAVPSWLDCTDMAMNVKCRLNLAQVYYRCNALFQAYIVLQFIPFSERNSETYQKMAIAVAKKMNKSAKASAAKPARLPEGGTSDWFTLTTQQQRQREIHYRASNSAVMGNLVIVPVNWNLLAGGDVRERQLRVSRDAFLSHVARAAPLIELRRTEEFGYGFYARQVIPKGTVLFEEDPWICATVAEDNCFHCFQPLKRAGLPCLACHCEVYCSAACRTAAHAAYHQVLCGINYTDLRKRIAANGTTLSSRCQVMILRFIGVFLTAVRALARADASASHLPLFHVQEWPDFVFQSQVRQIADSKYFQAVAPKDKAEDADYRTNVGQFVQKFAEIQRLVSDKLDGKVSDRLVPEQVLLDGDFLTVAIKIFSLFSFAVGTQKEKRTNAISHGAAIYRQGNYFNHSCVPNTRWSFGTESNRMTFSTFHKIDKGDQLFISYIPDNQTFEERQGHLKGQYGFTCQCELCMAQGAFQPA
jgi:SET and MYND domain-containing protein